MEYLDPKIGKIEFNLYPKDKSLKWVVVVLSFNSANVVGLDINNHIIDWNSGQENNIINYIDKDRFQKHINRVLDMKAFW